MPKLLNLNQDLEKLNLPNSGYHFSATRMADLGADNYTLVTIVNDVSGSTDAFRPEMTCCLKSVLDSCKLSPRCDNLMLRLVRFSTDVEEIHGFKLLEQCDKDDYDKVLDVPGGQTALFDATLNALEALIVYGKNLVSQDYGVNGLLVVITDGMDNASINTPIIIKEKLQESVSKEILESMVSILVGVNITQVGPALQSFAQTAQFTQYVDIGKADAKNLAKLAEFISKSISSQSQALGKGTAAPPLQF